MPQCDGVESHTSNDVQPESARTATDSHASPTLKNTSPVANADVSGTRYGGRFSQQKPTHAAAAKTKKAHPHTTKWRMRLVILFIR